MKLVVIALSLFFLTFKVLLANESTEANANLMLSTISNETKDVSTSYCKGVVGTMMRDLEVGCKGTDGKKKKPPVSYAKIIKQSNS